MRMHVPTCTCITTLLSECDMYNVMYMYKEVS